MKEVNNTTELREYILRFLIDGLTLDALTNSEIAENGRDLVFKEPNNSLEEAEENSLNALVIAHNLTASYFFNGGKEVLKVFTKSQYWKDAENIFFMKISFFKNIIEGNEKLLIEMLAEAESENANFIDDLLKDLVSNFENSNTTLLYAFLDKFKEYVKENAKKTAKSLKEPSEAIKIHPVDFVRWNTDRISNNIIDKFKEAQEKNGFAYIESANKKKNDTIGLYFSGDYNGKEVTFEELTEKLGIQTSYKDKLYYMIASTLYDAGNEYITASQIYKVLHNGKNPKQKDMIEIYESIERMSLIKVSINNTLEHDVYKRYKLEPATSRYFLAAETDVKGKSFRGQTADYVFHLLARPLLADFAKERSQFIDVKSKVFSDAEINYTERNLCIFDYLIQQVSMNSTDKGHGFIRFDSMTENLQLTERKQKARAIETAGKILKSFANNSLIEISEKSDDGFCITKDALDKKKAAPRPKVASTKPKGNKRPTTRRKG